MEKLLAALLLISSVTVSAQVIPTNLCAVIMSSTDHQETSVLLVYDRSSFSDLNKIPMTEKRDWNNKISIVKVSKGCTLVGYQYQDFNINYNTEKDIDGFIVALTNHSKKAVKTHVLDSSINNMISSLQCFCL